MTATERGFETLRRTCERLSIAVTLGAPSREAPATVLGQALDPALHEVYLEHDGVWWSSPEFSLRIYPLEGPDALEWRNISLRNSSADYLPPYPFDDLIAFAQYGRQSSYLAAVPKLGDESGRQPVLFLDTNEDPWAVPIASSVEGAFTTLAHCLDRAAGNLTEVGFPLESSDLIGKDDSLASLVRSGKFKNWTRGDESIQDWIRKTFAVR